MGLSSHPTNPVTDKIIGAAIEVHRHVGPGLLESSYHACLCRELELRALPYHSQLALPIEYKGVHLRKGYIVDLLVEQSVIVEIKAVEELLPLHSAQLMTYMRLLRIGSGLLLNFNVTMLRHGIKRLLL